MEGTPMLDGGLGVKSVDHHLGSKRTMILGSDQSNSSDGCRHFFIRGYVGEIRRLNRKICWPFAVRDNRDNLDEETERLPPLSVPKFKRWCCQKCSGFADICLDDQRGDILESTCDYNVKACAMHIELKVEHVPVDSREEYSRASNYESGCKNLLPISITSGIRNEGHEHLLGEKKMESLVSSTTAATTIENIHLSDCFVNAEGQEATETRHEELTAALGVKASQGKEKTRKKVAKRLVDRKQDELGQSKPVPDNKSENNVLSKLAFQVFSSKGFDEHSNIESDIPKSLGHSRRGCDQEKNLELKRKNIPGKGKKHVKIDIDHKKHHDIMSCSGCKDDRDAGSGSVVAEIGYLNLSSNDCDSSGNDYCLDESKIFSLHNVDHQMQGHLSLENCGSQHSNDQFCLDGTACRRRTQKTRLLSDIINECDMLVAMERVSVSKRIAAMGSLKERIIQAKTSSEGSPTKSHVAPHEEFTESNEMNNKAASHIRVSDSTTVGSSQDSLCSSSNKYEERTKVQGCLEVHENTNYRATGVAGDEQKDSETTIDEIPMDIVELMAKNQHERRLFHAAENKSMNQLMDTCSKRTPSIMDITAVLENDVASLLDEDVSVSRNLEYTDASDKMFTDTRDKAFTYASKASEIESDEMGMSPVIHRTDHISACKRKLPPTTDLSREPCFPYSDHYMKNFIQESGWNQTATGCRWLPASIQSAQEYDVLHIAPMQSSLSMHKSPVGMQSTQTMKFECHCCSRGFDYLESVVIAKGSGKMIDPGILDMKGINSRAAPYPQNGKEMVSKSPEKTYPFSWRNNQVDCHPKDMLVSDLYKNEAISAMNLLKLVNRDTLSSTSDKSCDESHARPMNESQFFHNSQSNVPVAPVGYGSNISETSLQPTTPEGRDLNFPLRSIGRLLSPLTDVSCACSLQKDRPLDTENHKNPFCSMGHFSPKVSLMMHRVMSSYPSPRECDQECFSGSHKCTPIHCLSQCARHSISISRHSHIREQLSSFRPTEICDEKDAKPQCGASDTKLEICTLNRNPAEINMYEEEDGSFIVQPEFHKFGKLSPTSNRYWKRQKTVKLAAIKANI